MLPAILPKVAIMAQVPRGAETTVSALCDDAGIECRVTGPSAERCVFLRRAAVPEASREPGSLGCVSIGLPESDKKASAILALGILAYGVFDYAARESLCGRPESRLALPLGRPRKAKSLTGAERQRRWRLTHD